VSVAEPGNQKIEAGSAPAEALSESRLKVFVMSHPGREIGGWREPEEGLVTTPSKSLPSLRGISVLIEEKNADRISEEPEEE